MIARAGAVLRRLVPAVHPEFERSSFGTAFENRLELRLVVGRIRTFRMAESELHMRRLRSIQERREQAAQLLAVATHRTVKEQVQLAQRDLDEADSWLTHTTLSGHPAILGIVELILELATWRLNLVQDALRTNGPHGTLVAQHSRTA